MHKIYTSYYARARRLNNDIYEFYAISNTAPSIGSDNKKLTFLKMLIPDSKTIVRPFKLGLINEEEYEKRYLEQLNNIDVFELRDLFYLILSLNKDKKPVLLCWEGANKFCHRHILAEYINNKLKNFIKVEELEVPGLYRG